MQQLKNESDLGVTLPFPVEKEPFGMKIAYSTNRCGVCSNTEEEAYRHIQEVIQMVIDELIEDDILIPILHRNLYSKHRPLSFFTLYADISAHQLNQSLRDC